MGYTFPCNLSIFDFVKAAILFILIGCTTLLHGQQAMFDALFFRGGEQTMVENTLTFDAQSILFKSVASDTIQGNLEITEIISNEAGIVDFQKFTLATPLFTRQNIQDFFDRKRFVLQPGNYTLKIALKDLNKDEAPVQFSQPIAVPDFTKPSISSIEFLAGLKPENGNSYFHKGGFLTEPLVSNYFPSELEKILVYAELYNLHKAIPSGEGFVSRIYIRMAGKENHYGEYVKFKRHKSGELIPLIQSFDIQNLASGNYEIVVECRDKENNLLFGKSRKFTRSNPEVTQIDYNQLVLQSTFVAPVQSLDTIRRYIDYLTPIAGKTDLRIIQKQEEVLVELEACKKFFYGFWVKRNPENPSISWAQYKQLVMLANANFGNKVRPGYLTDRGRIFLKYGPPNSRFEQPSEPEAVPYEIWHYYKLGQYNNRKFVFYSPDVVTNEFFVLHSDVPGEVQNQNWLSELYKKTANSSWSRNASENNNPFGRRALELFNNPR